MKTNTKMALSFVSGIASAVLAVTIVNGVKAYFAPTPEFVNLKASLSEELELPVEEIRLYRYDMEDSKWLEVCPDINQYVEDFSVLPGSIYTLKEGDSEEVILGVTWKQSGSFAGVVSDRMYFNGKSAKDSIVYNHYQSGRGDTFTYLVEMDVPIEVESTANICRVIDIECNKHLG